MSNLKNNKLEKLRGLFFQIGLIFAISISLVAFNWKAPLNTYHPKIESSFDDVEEDTIPLTFYDREIEQPKPKLRELPKLNPNDFKIVEEEPIEPEKEVEKPEDDEPDFDLENMLSGMGEDDVKDVDTIPLPPSALEKMPYLPPCKDIQDKDESLSCLHQELMLFIKDNQQYPVMAREMNQTGTVYLSFVISNKGKITQVKTVRSPHKLLEKEARRLVKSFPEFTPAKQRGRPVAMKMTIPIKFNLH